MNSTIFWEIPGQKVIKIKILNIKIDNVDMLKASARIVEFIASDSPKSFLVVTPNSEIVVRAQKDHRLARILNKADLAVPDGAGIVLASRILAKKPLPERVAGFDLLLKLLSLAVQNNYRIYLLGGRPGIVERARDRITAFYPGVNICGQYHGYLERQEQKKIISEINQLKPDLLFVGMGVPLQEKFLAQNLPLLKVKVAMTVGGSFDILAGEASRAPLWLQRANLEWFYRLLKEPARLERMLALPKFVYLIGKEFLGKYYGNYFNK